jgi:hypothetical protein
MPWSTAFEARIRLRGGGRLMFAPIGVMRALNGDRPED